MENSTGTSGVMFHNVVFDAEGITLYDGRSKLLNILKKDIRRITLKHGFQSERPLMQILFGVGIIVLGIYFMIHFFLKGALQRVIVDVGCLSPLLVPVGGWFLLDGFKKRLYFEVSLSNDRRKFPLGKNPDKGELQKFVNFASQLGYSIDVSILHELDQNQKMEA